MYMAMLMSELQYYSSGWQIYYWFGSAYGVIHNGENKTYLKYIHTEQNVKEALVNGARSVRPWVNEILDREREFNAE